MAKLYHVVVVTQWLRLWVTDQKVGVPSPSHNKLSRIMADPVL